MVGPPYKHANTQNTDSQVDITQASRTQTFRRQQQRHHATDEHKHVHLRDSQIRRQRPPLFLF